MQSLFQKLSGFFLSPTPAEATVSPERHAMSEEQDVLGCNSMSTKHFNEAISFFNKAIELDPSDPFPHYSKAMAYEALGRYQEALIACDKAIKRDPKCAIAYNAKAIALYALGRMDEALAVVDKAISIDHKHHEPQHLRERILSAIQSQTN